MIDFTELENELTLAKQKSGLEDGNTIASSASIEHLIHSVDLIYNILKQMDSQKTP